MSTKPLLTQIRPTYFSVDCGMAYLIRLENGKFILIDSTFGEYDEVDHIYSLLCEQNETPDLPCVAAWFFTHPHSDHTNGFIRMARDYAEKLTVEKVVFNFPADLREKTHDHKSFLAAIESFGAEVVTPQRGNVLSFGGAKFEVLFAADDCTVRPVNVNETSLTMIMTLGLYRVMWMGDLQRVGSGIVMSSYPPERLKCDILQVGHHGYWGGSFELFSAVDPDVIIWPMPEYRYLDMLAEPYNRFFTSPENHSRHTFISGIEETTLDLTAPIPPSAPYSKAKISAPLAKKSVSALGWSCITGGSMGYTPSVLEFCDDECTLTTLSSRTLLQLIQRGRIAISRKYEFRMSITPEAECETLGLIYDCPKPTAPDSFAVYHLPHKAGERLNVTLRVDRSACKAEISVNGRVDTLLLGTQEPCDIILILKGAKIKVSKAEFENL